MSTAAKLADINIIADQKFAPPRLCQVRGDGMAAWPSQVPGRMLHLQRTESPKAGKKEQTLFCGLGFYKLFEMDFSRQKHGS